MKLKYFLLVVYCILFTGCVNHPRIEISKTLEEMAKNSLPQHDEVFYQEFLETFCQQHFDDKFCFKRIIGKGAVKYEVNSLRVTSIARRNDGTDIIQGTISFSYAYGVKKCTDGRFTAFVTDKGDGNEYLVTFERNGGYIDGNIKSTGETPFIYSTLE